MTTGRPLKYKNPEELQKQFDLYKADRDTKELPYTKESFVLSLGFIDEQALDKSYKDKELFYIPIKKMFAEIISSKIDYGYSGKGNTSFAIFDFKCNHGWNDKSAEKTDDEVDVIGFEFNVVKPSDS